MRFDDSRHRRNMGIFLEHDWFSKPLPDNVVLEDRSWLYSSFAFQHYRSQRPVGLRLGENSGVYEGSFFNLGPHGEVSIGRYCSLVGVIINCNTQVRIDDFALLAHEVVLADSCVAIPFSAARPLAEEPPDRCLPPRLGIVLEKNVWIGARAILLEGARIGAGSIVGAAAVVDFEVPPFSLVAGNPAKVIRRLA